MSYSSRVRVVALGVALVVYSATGTPAHAADPISAGHSGPTHWHHLVIPHANIAVHPDPICGGCHRQETHT